MAQLQKGKPLEIGLNVNLKAPASYQGLTISIVIQRPPTTMKATYNKIIGRIIDIAIIIGVFMCAATIVIALIEFMWLCDALGFKM